MAKTTFSGPVLEGKEGVNIETKASNYTVTNADSGKTFISETDGVVFTLPAIAVGYSFKFANNAPDGANALTISPNASDGITYAGSSTDEDALAAGIINESSDIGYDDVEPFANVEYRVQFGTRMMPSPYQDGGYVYLVIPGSGTGTLAEPPALIVADMENPARLHRILVP